jgi:hypothetical protein
VGLFTEFKTKVDQRRPEGTLATGGGGGGYPCICSPDGPRHPRFCWNRRCVPRTSDPKILGVLGQMLGRESSGDRGTLETMGLSSEFGPKVAWARKREWVGWGAEGGGRG